MGHSAPNSFQLSFVVLFTFVCVSRALPEYNNDEITGLVKGFLEEQRLSFDQVRTKLDNIENSIHRTRQDLLSQLAENAEVVMKLEARMDDLTSQMDMMRIESSFVMESELTSTRNDVETMVNNSIAELAQELTTPLNGVAFMLNKIFNEIRNQKDFMETALDGVTIGLQTDDDWRHNAVDLEGYVNDFGDIGIDKKGVVDKDKNKGNLSCKRGWLYNEGSCYYFGTKEGSWSIGRQQCQAKGGDYVKISSDNEFDFVAGQITANSWIGLNDLDEDGDYKWISDGSKEVGRPDRWWHANQPDNMYGGSEDCVHFWFAVDKVLLNDAHCSQKQFRFICEMKPTFRRDLETTPGE